jgi:beta-galactosidase
MPEYQVRPDGEFAYSVLLRPLSRAEVQTGRPGDQVACAPRAKLRLANDTIEPGGTTDAQLTVTNPCQRPLENVFAKLDAPAGWTVTPPAATIGQLPAGRSVTTNVKITRGADTPGGRRPVTAEVTATRVSTFASAELLGMPKAPSGTAAVSTLEFITAQNGWGPVERDLSNGEQGIGDGRPISIGGKTYATGLGVHPESAVELYLGGRCTTLTTDIGLDDEVGDSGSVVFEVLADGTRRYQSPVLTGSGQPVPVTVDVTGAKLLRLKVTDGADGNAHDHADWAAATLTCS